VPAATTVCCSPSTVSRLLPVAVLGNPNKPHDRFLNTLLEGLGERRTVRRVVRELQMPLADAEDVVARVRG
jgi:hypothetical protein